MKRRAAGTSGEPATMPAHLCGPVYQRMAAFYDAAATVPDCWFREPTSAYGTRAEQAARWRAAVAFRRAQDARRGWLAEHGYVSPGGHVDWQRFHSDQAAGKA